MREDFVKSSRLIMHDWTDYLGTKKYPSHVIASVIVILSQVFTWKSLTGVSRRQRRTSLGASRFSGEDARIKLNPIVDGIHERRYIFRMVLERDIRKGEPWMWDLSVNTNATYSDLDAPL